MIQVVLVDPDRDVRRALQMRLELESDLMLVGQAGDLPSAMEIVATLCPDVVILDPEMPGVDAIVATGDLARCCSGSRVLVLSLLDDSHTRRQALAAGAAAFVGKQESLEVLLETIRKVAAPA